MPKSRKNSRLSRRHFLHASASASALALLPSAATAEPSPCGPDLPAAFTALKPLSSRVRPVAAEEFHSRMARAQQLMTDGRPRFDAMLLAPGTSLYYFTGIRWVVSERLLALVLPRAGEPFLVCPEFEEGRLREQLQFPAEIRAWREDQNPARLVADSLAERGLRSGRMGIEETTPFTFFDHLRDAAPRIEYSSADPVTVGCRGRKSDHELDLMRLACEATCDVFRAVFASLREGMSQDDIERLIEAGFSKIDLRGGALVLIGASAALPHGTLKQQKLREGDVVLIDGGTSVEGYASDVTRTGVFGKPPEKVARAFATVREAQDAALAAARAGRLAGSVDDAARAVIIHRGYGPGYRFFTHRLGHGIGLDGHEHPYLVRGSKTVLDAGMTFSNEPGIYVPGEYGVRCEDDMVIAAEGPARLLTPAFAASLVKPLG